MEKKLYSKWRPSAILNLRKLQFWSRDLYRHVIFHFICYDVIILHPKNAFYVPNFVLNFHDVRFRNF